MSSTAATTVSGTQQAQRAAKWRSVLSPAVLSPRFVDRYAIILAQLEEHALPEVIASANAVAAHHPSQAAAILSRGAAPTLTAIREIESPQVKGDGTTADLIRKLVARHPDVTGFITAQSPLERAAVPLHPSRLAHLVTFDGNELVALRWAGSSVSTRLLHQERLTPILRKAARTTPLPIRAHEDYALVEMPGEDLWVFAPNLGATLEDELRSERLGVAERLAVVRSLATLREAMIAMGIVWQGFAPRNMFFLDGELVLIDFEDAADVRTEPVRAAECLLWHRVFFADCLTPVEAAALFAPVAGEPEVAGDHIVVADDFERALLGVAEVPWHRRRALLVASAALEGRHIRPTAERDNGILFGHELGHFWGDFVPVEVEARLFRHLTNVVEPERLVACLEALEAAMEADICRALRSRAGGTADLSAPRTLAVVDLLDAVGAEGLACHRAETSDWYERVSTDPGLLVDGLVHNAGSVLGDLDRAALDTYLVGSGGARKAHDESLTAATRIGLDFIHRAEHGESYLNHLNADELSAMLGEAVPYDGIDLDALLAQVESEIVRYSISQSHPRYLAFPDSGNAISAMAGGILSRMLNQNLIAVDRSAPAATFIEIQVVEWLRELVGYQSAPLTDLRGVRDVAGLWATGGHLSNHLAMLVALGRRFPEVRRLGLRALDTQPAVVMAGPIAHYSHSDAAFHLGLGWDSVISVGAKAGYTTDPDAVEAALADPPDGKTPFMVVGVAGNCRTTGLDDLTKLAEICRRYGVWFHADACHGGSLIFSDRLRRRHLAGIERADSVSLDPHKGLFTPYPSSYVVFRERGVLNQFSRHESALTADGCWDLGLITPFLGSRGFESLATWMLMRHIGVRRLADLVEGRQAHVRYLERRIDETGLFVCLNEVDFYRLAFVLRPPEVRQILLALDPERRHRAARIISRHTSRLNTELYRSGEVCFDEHTLADLADRIGAGRNVSYTVMAACPGNPLLTRADLDQAVERLVHAARPAVAALLDDLAGETDDPSGPPTVAGPAGWGDLP